MSRWRRYRAAAVGRATPCAPLRQLTEYLQPAERRGAEMHCQRETDTCSQQIGLLHSGRASGRSGLSGSAPQGRTGGGADPARTDRLDGRRARRFRQVPARAGGSLGQQRRRRRRWWCSNWSQQTCLPTGRGAPVRHACRRSRSALHWAASAGACVEPSGYCRAPVRPRRRRWWRNSPV